MRAFGYLAAVGLLLAVCVSIAAEDSAPPGPVAWVEVQTSDPEAEVLRPVVEDAARYRLAGLGLAPRMGGAPTWISAGRTPGSSAPLLEAAVRAGADFALECRYSGSGSRLALQLNWYEVSTSLMTAAVDRRGRVDLVLDTLILDALDELLDRVRPRIEERVAEYRARQPVQEQPAAAGGAGLASGSPGTAASPGMPVPTAPSGSAPASGAPVGSAAPASPAAGAAPPQPRADGGSPAAGTASQPSAAGALPQGGAEPGPLPGAAPGPGPAAPTTGRYQGARLLIAPSLAPFLAVGAASYYFPIGYQSLLHVDFLPAAAGARLGLGILLGVTAFQAQGATESSLGFLVPVGLSLRYSLELGRRWAVLFQLGGGAALLLLGTDSQGSLAKMLPYVRSGIGAELALGRRLGLGLEAAYEVYFERPYLIMGFAPGLCLNWRL